MPNCEYFEELCSASLDGELTRVQKRELDTHLAACPACAAYLEDLKLLRTAWGDLKEPLPDELHERIMGGVLEEAQKKVKPMEKRKRRPPVFTMLAAAAACVMLAMSGAVGDLLGGLDAQETGDKTANVAAGGAAMEEASETSGETNAPAPQAAEDGSGVSPSTLVPAQEVQPQPAPETEKQTGADEDSGAAGNQAPEAAGSASGAAPAVASAKPHAGGRSIDANAAEKQSITLPDDLQTHQFVLCYVAVGSGDPLLLKDATLLEKIDNVYYFEVPGGMSAVETDIKVLQDGGFETAIRSDIGVALNESAESSLLILVVEG